MIDHFFGYFAYLLIRTPNTHCLVADCLVSTVSSQISATNFQILIENLYVVKGYGAKN